MAEEARASHWAGEVTGYVCERCDRHQTMTHFTDPRLWKDIGRGYFASHDPGEVDPPIAQARYVCKHCGWETTKPRKDTGPWATDEEPF